MIYIDVDTAVTVPVNIMPLIDDTDFITRETAIAYNESGMDLVWNFVTPAGVITQTAVTPTTAGDYDWTHVGDGMYKIEITASGGASINNDTEGVGYFSGLCDGVLPWRGPDIVFRAAGLNDALIESAYSTTRGLAGTALPDAAADAAGGLVVSDAGGFDIDAIVSNIWDEVLTSATHNVNNSAGKRLRRINNFTRTDDNTVIDEGTAQSGGASTIQIRAAYAGVIAAGALVTLEDGTGAGQFATVDSYDDPTNTITIVGTWDTNPDATTEYHITESGGAVGALTAADVNAEMLDVLNVDTFAELGAVPSATSTIIEKLTWMFMLARNDGLNTNALKTLRNDADSADVATSTVADDGTTFTRGKWS